MILRCPSGNPSGTFVLKCVLLQITACIETMIALSHRKLPIVDLLGEPHERLNQLQPETQPSQYQSAQQPVTTPTGVTQGLSEDQYHPL